MFFWYLGSDLFLCSAIEAVMTAACHGLCELSLYSCWILVEQ